MDRREEFLDTLAAALATGRRGGHFNCMLWLPKVMAYLCAEALVAGIETEYVERLIKKRGLLPGSPDVASWPWPVKIYTLGRFSLVIDDVPVAFARKAPKKPIALLKFIVAAGDRPVPITRALDALWPDEEGDAAQKSFQITLHRLRKLLQHADALQLQQGRLSLNAALCWVDSWAFERLAVYATAAPDSPHEDAKEAPARALALYDGNFLSDDLEEPWTLSLRERLRARYIRLVGLQASRLIENGDLEAAIDSTSEVSQPTILPKSSTSASCAATSSSLRPAEALAVYHRLRRTLAITLGVPPSPATEALFRALQEH
ncbi:MAG: hypothetical protein H0V34_11975 [Gammaproteobacteria bacterium]|nr:hypothetical protein [Gammaproteobacteria bacterium]